MIFDNLIPILIILSAFIPGLIIFGVPEHKPQLRRAINLSANIVCLILIGLLINGVYSGVVFETRLPLLPTIDLVLHADALSLLFVSLSGLLWLFTTIYAIGYLEGSENRSRFFGFFSLCVAATLGIALAGNLITFLIFYELLTLVTYPLVVHKGNAASLRAGRVYLTYTLIGGALLLAGVVWLKALAGPLDFTTTGVLSAMPELDPTQLKIIFALIIAGLGVKAALFPFHGWLPIAMAAPAPVSALLHAVAVVKAGAFGIVRVVYDVYGIEFARDLGLTVFLAGIAAFTIVYGSVLALRQDDLKKRLAYSTVSQVSYIALGASIAGPIATIGGMVHLVHQGVMKITLFFCAGNLAETVGVYKVSQMNGVGRRMPITMAAFTIAALGMIGLPPVAGFVSKWYLGMGAIEVGSYWVLLVLATSSLLNALYFLPILHAVWFKEPSQPWPRKEGTQEAYWMLWLPPLATSILSVAVGLFASSSLSPLSWVELITALEYGKEIILTLDTVSFTLSPFEWIVLFPLLIALSLASSRIRKMCLDITPLAALPTLIISLLLLFDSNQLFGLVLSETFILDQHSRVLLFLSASLWIAAGLYGKDYLAADKNIARYTLFFLLCMSGSFGLVLSQDLLGFITFFALMSFAAYGLVIHSGSDEAMRAGRTYIQWVVIGELLLFAALVGIAVTSGSGNLLDLDKSVQPTWVTWLLLIGFGIKAGLLGTHFWLPRAHPVAPIPASALLSGLMVKAGLIGWWRFLPLGELALAEIGQTLIVLGLGGAFLAIVAGMFQRNPKTLLAYSTISQMGILASAVGVGLWQPTLWPLLSGALLIYVVHHGLAKSALFLSVGLVNHLSAKNSQRWIVWLFIAIPAIAMAGFPFTSGALAKSAVKQSVSDISWFVLLLNFTAVGTTLLMLRFMNLLRDAGQQSTFNNSFVNLRLCTHAALIVLVLSVIYWLPQTGAFVGESTSYSSLFKAMWPILIGLIIFALTRLFWTKAPTVPAGDLIVIIEKAFHHVSWFTSSSIHTAKISAGQNTSFIYSFQPINSMAFVKDSLVIRVAPGIVFISILVVLSLLFVLGAL